MVKYTNDTLQKFCQKNNIELLADYSNLCLTHNTKILLTLLCGYFCSKQKPMH